MTPTKARLEEVFVVTREGALETKWQTSLFGIVWLKRSRETLVLGFV
jgi:hypothetical protein